MRLPRLSASLALCAAGWMVLFGALHVYWAAGGTFGLLGDLRVDDRIGLLVVDLLAIPVCLLAAGVFLTLARTAVRGDRPGVLVLAWLACLIGLLHATPTVASDLGAALGWTHQTLSTPTDRFIALVYEPLWMTTAVICGLAAAVNTTRRHSRVGPATG